MIKIRSFFSIIDSLKESSEFKMKKCISNINNVIINERNLKETRSNIFFEEIDSNLKSILGIYQKFYKTIIKRLKNYLDVMNPTTKKNEIDEKEISKIEDMVLNYKKIIREKDSLISTLEKNLKIKESEFLFEKEKIKTKIEKLKKEIEIGCNMKLHEKENLKLREEEKTLNIIELNNQVKRLKMELEQKKKEEEKIEKNPDSEEKDFNTKKVIEQLQIQIQHILNTNNNLNSRGVFESKSFKQEEKIGKYKEKLKNLKEKIKILEEGIEKFSELINAKNFEIFGQNTKLKELERENIEMEEYIQQREKQYNKLKLRKNQVERKLASLLRDDNKQFYEDEDDFPKQQEEDDEHNYDNQTEKDDNENKEKNEFFSD